MGQQRTATSMPRPAGFDRRVGIDLRLTYRATVDMPARFRKSKSVGAVFGLTPSRDQSGERDRPGANIAM